VPGEGDERERGVCGGWEGSWQGHRSARVFIAPRARVREGVGELWATAIIGGRAAGRVADIRAPPLGKLREGRAGHSLIRAAKGTRLASLLWGLRASVIHGVGRGLAQRGAPADVARLAACSFFLTSEWRMEKRGGAVRRG
jgi:hypothetical protein